MSYILQALRKSEQERTRAAQESSIKIPESATASDDAETAPISEPTPDESIFPMAVYAWLGGFILVLLLISVAVQYHLGNQSSDDVKAVITPLELKAVEPKTVEPKAIEPSPVKAAASQSALSALLIPVEQATQTVQSSVPIIDISSHIYSSLPERRSIVINGARLVEGDFIAPAVQVKEITHQGMIITVDGMSLIVDRSRGWSR